MPRCRRSGIPRAGDYGTRKVGRYEGRMIQRLLRWRVRGFGSQGFVSCRGPAVVGFDPIVRVLLTNASASTRPPPDHTPNSDFKNVRRTARTSFRHQQVPERGAQVSRSPARSFAITCRAETGSIPSQRHAASTSLNTTVVAPRRSMLRSYVRARSQPCEATMASRLPTRLCRRSAYRSVMVSTMAGLKRDGSRVVMSASRRFPIGQSCGCRKLVWTADLRLCPSRHHRVIALRNCAIHPNRPSLSRPIRRPARVMRRLRDQAVSRYPQP
jgi:hypothetical protein